MKSPGSRKESIRSEAEGKMCNLEPARSWSFVQMPTRYRLATICLSSLLFVTSAFAGAPEGIPRELAPFRAQQIKDVRYQLSYTITPKANSVVGHEDRKSTRLNSSHMSTS